MFFSDHNEKIKNAYGNYCFWAWLRYWYIDSVNLVTTILLDKGYFDYDFEKTDTPVVIADWEDTVLDEEETANVVAMFGIGRRKPETIEEVQNYLIKEEGYGS